MNEVRLTGELICTDKGHAALVTKFLPRHLNLTRAEPGCLSFEVVPTQDPLVWSVSERFNSEAAFSFHRERVANSEWGRETSGITRNYSIEGLPS